MAPAMQFVHEDLAGVTLLCRNVKTGFITPGGSYTTTNSNTNPQTLSGSTLVMSSDIWGSTVNINTVASTITLPAAIGSGNTYTIVIGTSTTSSHVVQAAGSDKIFGTATVAATTGGVFTVNNNTTFTMSATTTGGLKGGFLTFTDVATNFWLCEVALVGTGTAATPVSA